MNRMNAALLALLCLSGLSFAGATTKPGPVFIRPFPLVAIPPDAPDVVKTAAQKVADALGYSVGRIAANPVCCIWIQITGWTPNPGQPGYVIINQPGGSIISASNDEQLTAAVARYIRSIRKRAKDVEVPEGLLTNYPVFAAEAAK